MSRKREKGSKGEMKKICKRKPLIRAAFVSLEDLVPLIGFYFIPSFLQIAIIPSRNFFM
jgi:hypothetical protein